MKTIKTNIRKNDKVVVITGINKGKEGRVLEIDRKKYRAIVEGVNIVKKHTKPNKENQQGGIIDKEAYIHLSNIMLIDSTGKPSRVKRVKDGKNIKRISIKTGEEIK